MHIQNNAKAMPSAPIYILVAMLLLPVLNPPIGYYTLLRIVACGVFGWAAFTSFKKQASWLPWLFVLLAIIFNPIIEFAFGRALWVAIDLLAAISLFSTRNFLNSADSTFELVFPTTLKQKLLWGLFVISTLMLVAFASLFAIGEFNDGELFGVAFWAVCAAVSYRFGIRRPAA